MKKTLRYSILLTAIIGIGTIVFFYVFQSNKRLEANRVETIMQYLSKAQNLKGSALEDAVGNAHKALQLSITGSLDTLTVEAYLVLGKNLSLQGKNNEAVQVFEKALNLSDKLCFSSGKANALMEIGILHYDWGNYTLSFQYFSRVIKIAQSKNLDQLSALANNYIGKYYHTTGNFNKSVEYYRKAIKIHQQMGNIQQSASVLLSIGKTYMNEGNIQRALECYLKAYEEGEQLDNFITLSDVSNHLGTIYLVLHQPDKSLEYHRKALLIRSFMKAPEGMAKSHNNIGETFLSMANLDSALFHFERSLQLCKNTGYKKGMVKSLTNLGNVFVFRKDYAKANKFLLEAFLNAQASGYETGVAESSLALGNSYYEQNKCDTAIFYFSKSLDKAEKANLNEVVLKANFGLFQCYHLQQNIKKALEYYITFSQLEKKKLLAENNQQLAELRVTFESEKKEQDNQFLRKENELKEMSIKRKSAFMWLFLIGLAFTILLCIIIYSRFEGKRKANRELSVLNDKILIQNKALDKLNKELEQANQEKDKILSIIAHELRNPLFWFQNLAEVLSKRYHTMSSEKIQKSLASLDESAKNAFHLMDNLLHWSRSRLNRIIPRKASLLLDLLLHESSRMYETILQQKEITLKVDCPHGTRVFVDSDLFTCVVRNILSNAIKFTPTMGFIEIKCIENVRFVTISISDSGVGIENENIQKLFAPDQYYSIPGLMQEKGSGFGLKLCKEFVELNGGEIWVKSETGKGTQFDFTVPVSLPVHRIEQRNSKNEIVLQ